MAIRTDEDLDQIQRLIDAAVAAEREACKKIAVEHQCASELCPCQSIIAKAIEARGAE